MIWFLEIILFVAFVAIGGFPGFIAWAVLTAIILFVQHSNRQAALKAAELVMRDEERQGRIVDQRASRPQLGSALPPFVPQYALPELAEAHAEDVPAHHWLASPGGTPLDFRTMMWGNARMVRRVSAIQWEQKYERGYRAERMRYVRRLLETPPVADGIDEVDRPFLQDELDGLAPEPSWKSLPEKYIAAI